jgi:hypothetical protein
VPAPRSGWRAPWHLPPGRLRLARLVRGLLVATPVLALGGLIEGDYVGAAKGMGLLLPALVGLACTAAMSRAAAPERGPLVTLLGAGLGALAALLGFWSAQEPYGGVGDWLPPVLAGVVGAIGWAWYDRPVQARGTSR